MPRRVIIDARLPDNTVGSVGAPTYQVLRPTLGRAGREIQMTSYFFISVPANEHRPLVSRFHRDLEHVLRKLVGTHASGLLETRLRSSRDRHLIPDSPARTIRTMVALCSDSYFGDGDRGVEWALFSRRISLTHPGTPLASPNSGLIPVVWRPLTAPEPNVVAGLLDADQTLFGEPYARLGLAALFKIHPMGPEGYYAAVKRIAGRILTASKTPLPELPPTEVGTMLPAFGTNPAATSTVSASSVLVPPALTPAPMSDGKESAPDNTPPAPPVKIVVSYVGADQAWADWVASILGDERTETVLVRWSPHNGETLASTTKKIRREKADLVVAVLSRRYREPYTVGSDPEAHTEDWALLGEEGALGPLVVRVVVDHVPVPAPLRALPSIDLDVGGDLPVRQLLEAASSSRATDGGGAGAATARRPGDFPPGWNTPAENEFFTGRDEELSRIHDFLTRQSSVVLTAEGGADFLGIRETAVEYAHRYQLRYDAVWWVDCASTTLTVAEQLGDYRVLPRLLDLHHQLLVFLNADQPGECVALARPYGARALIVTVAPVSEWDGEHVKLGPLRRSESIALLREVATDVDPAVADLLAAVVGDRPSLLAEIARTVLRLQLDPLDCLRLLKIGTHGAAVAARSPGDQRPDPPPRLGVRPADDDPERRDASPRLPATDAATANFGEHSAPQPIPSARPRSRHSARELDSLRGELVGIDYINEPANFDRWIDALEWILGRQPVFDRNAPLAARLLSLLEVAGGQPGPGMLDALSRPRESVVPHDRSADLVVPAPLTVRTQPSPGTVSATAPVAGPKFSVFTSYARRADRDSVLQFHNKIQAEVNRKNRNKVPSAGFLDQLSIEGGAHWRAELVEAVRCAPMLLVLFSDDYFAWCGREFAIFQERVRRSNHYGSLPHPAVVPIPWLDPDEQMPPAVSDLQIARRNLGQPYDDMPVVGLMRRHPRIFGNDLIFLRRVDRASRSDDD